MASIRTFDGPIYLCAACGQPCHDSRVEGYSVLAHFDEQWDGIHCPEFPLAAGRIEVDWDEDALQDLKEKYPDTHPNHEPAASDSSRRSWEALARHIMATREGGA
jgi:hypothetical protein